MLAMGMVGRSAELGEVRTAWAALTSNPRTISITGPGGSGKTTLVGASLAALTPKPRPVLAGRARVHSPAPYDWLAALLSGRDLSALPAPLEALAWLAQRPDVPAQRFAPGALLRVAVQLVRHLVGRGPALLVVEDLHALDPASLNLIAELAHLPELPALLLVTSRPTTDPLASLTLDRLRGTPGAVRQHLGPLAAEEVASLTTQVYPDADPGLAHFLWQRCAGNPGAIVELLAQREFPPAPATTAEDPELTAREREVLACLRSGMSNKQIARTLAISVRTVAVHVSNVLRKTGSASRTEAALWAIRSEPSSPTALPRSPVATGRSRDLAPDTLAR